MSEPEEDSALIQFDITDPLNQWAREAARDLITARVQWLAEDDARTAEQYGETLVRVCNDAAARDFGPHLLIALLAEVATSAVEALSAAKRQPLGEGLALALSVDGLRESTT